MASLLKTWEIENAVKLVDPTRDALYTLDLPAIKAENDARPWRSNPHHFSHVRVSAVALLKMVMHARSGGSLEIMGLMQGYVRGDTIVVTDAFRLPVEGTETRVNAQDQANEYMVQFLQRARDAGQAENAVGWYHSHPGYGCWLSGIDVNTQMTQQMYSDPFVAVVIDPDRTISAGKVDIGAFRTFPENYKPESSSSPSNNNNAGNSGGDEDSQTIPLAKIEDFGAHADRYYSLEVTHFKSSLDNRLIESLWNKYWVGTLSSSPLLTNREYGTRQIADLALKIRQADKVAREKAKNGGGGVGGHALGMDWGGGGGGGGGVGGGGGGGAAATGKDLKTFDSPLDKLVRAGNKIVAEEEAGLLAGVIKEKLFCGIGTTTTTTTTHVDAVSATNTAAEKEQAGELDTPSREEEDEDEVDVDVDVTKKTGGESEDGR